MVWRGRSAQCQHLLAALHFTSVCHHDNMICHLIRPLHSSIAASVVSNAAVPTDSTGLGATLHRAICNCILARRHQVHAIFQACQHLQLILTASENCACSNIAGDGKHAFFLRRLEEADRPEEQIKLDLHTAEKFWLEGRCMTEARATAAVRAWVTVLRDVLCESS